MLSWPSSGSRRSQTGSKWLFLGSKWQLLGYKWLHKGHQARQKWLQWLDTNTEFSIVRKYGYLVEIKYGQKVLNPEMGQKVWFWNEDGYEMDKVLVI